MELLRIKVVLEKDYGADILSTHSDQGSTLITFISDVDLQGDFNIKVSESGSVNSPEGYSAEYAPMILVSKHPIG